MDAFDQMMNSLNSINALNGKAFKDTNAVRTVSTQDYERFLKEVIFEKLKGKRLGQAFCERFDVRDRVLSMYTLDKNALDHIKTYKYVKNK